MSVGKNLPGQTEFGLILRLKQSYDALRQARSRYDNNARVWRELGYSSLGLDTTIEAMNLALHRLRFLEMVVKGLTYQEQRDARDYAKFIQSKRKLEDMDVDELRSILREQ